MNTKKFNKILFSYYSVVLCSLVAMISFGTYVYWHKGPLNYDNIFRVFELEKSVKDLTAGVYFEKIIENIENDKVQSSINELKAFEKISKSVQTKFPVKDYSKIESGFVNLNTSLQKMLVLSKVSELLNSIENKTARFEKYTRDNSWPTLIRMSSDLKSSIVNRTSQGPTHLNSLKTFKQNLKTSVSKMKSVALASGLSRDDKNSITAKIDSIEKEISLLNDYVSAFSAYTKSHLAFQAQYLDWAKELKNYVGFERENFESSVKKFILFAVALSGIILLSGLVGLWIYVRLSNNVEERKVEQYSSIVDNVVSFLGDNFKSDESSIALKKQLELLGKDHLITKIGQIEHQKKRQMEAYKKEIDFLEEKTMTIQSMLSDIELVLDQNNESSMNKAINVFEDLRDSVVKNVEEREKLLGFLKTHLSTDSMKNISSEIENIEAHANDRDEQLHQYFQNLFQYFKNKEKIIRKIHVLVRKDSQFDKVSSL